jgi:hypothetical protein
MSFFPYEEETLTDGKTHPSHLREPILPVKKRHARLKPGFQPA